MKRSLLRSFAWISLAMLPAVSCRSVRISSPAEQAFHLKEFISTEEMGRMTFRTKVLFSEREISGLMLVKKIPDGNFRVAFYNELGMNYIDGILEDPSGNGRFVVNNVLPLLDHSLFFKNFERCLQVLLSENIEMDLNGYQYITISSGVRFSMEISPQITQINTD